MIRTAFLVVFAVGLHLPAWAQKDSPEDVVRTAVEGVMSSIKADPAARSGDTQRIARVVEQGFLPHTDFLRTTRMAVGAAWQNASPEQQNAVFEQFQALLVHTYSLELTQISSQDIKFEYGQPGKATTAGDVIVKTRMKTTSDDDEIDYRLAKTAGGWKIYDINILGAWLSSLYRNQFAGRLAQGGIDGLIGALREHNGREGN
ncbi:MAG: ABC transporter substrate-binding protein [Burkholderiaceae bacterium]|jgi:ABC-type transporter MlaC component